MEACTAIRLEKSGPRGEEMVLVVDFSAKTATLLLVNPGNGNVSVGDVQDYSKRGS